MERFINNVKKRSALWDTRQPENYNRPLVRQLWSQVEDESYMEPGSAAKKFKSLKDTFRREYLRGPEKSKWIYFKHMLFLKDIIYTKKPITAALSSAATAPFESNENSTDHQETDDLGNDESIIEIVPHNEEFNLNNNKRKQINDSPPLAMTTSKRHQTENEYRQRSSTKRFESAELDKADEDDDDFHFLMSCRMYLKQMPSLKKLKFRIKMQELIYKTLYDEEANLASTSSCNRTATAFEENKTKNHSDFAAPSVDNDSIANDFNEFEDIKPNINELQIV